MASVENKIDKRFQENENEFERHKTATYSFKGLFTKMQGREKLNTRLRQVAGICMLGLAASAFTMISLRRKAAEAYITGDVIHIRSPMQGKVASEPLGTGEMFNAGQVLVRVTASRSEETKQESTLIALERVNSEILAIETQLYNLTQANITRLRNDVQTAGKELQDLEGMERRYQQQEKRYRQLVKIGALDSESLAGSEAARNSYTQRRTNQQRIVTNLRQELSDAEKNTRTGNTELPRPSRRLEILEIEIVGLNQKLKELRAKKQEFLSLGQNNLKQKYFIYRPWFNGMILSNKTAKDSEINASEILMTIVNCDKLKIEALFDANRVSSKKIGHPAIVKANNSKKEYSARIISIRGVKSIRSLEGPDAASFKATNDDRMRVHISLPYGFKQRECRLGERVEVSL